jgi:hypothetical protein
MRNAAVLSQALADHKIRIQKILPQASKKDSGALITGKCCGSPLRKATADINTCVVLPLLD